MEKIFSYKNTEGIFDAINDIALIKRMIEFSYGGQRGDIFIYKNDIFVFDHKSIDEDGVIRSCYFFTKNKQFLYRISDHWSNLDNLGAIGSCFWRLNSFEYKVTESYVFEAWYDDDIVDYIDFNYYGGKIKLTDLKKI